jgi:hypothetical protein
MKTLPTNPVGHVPGKDFVDTGDASGLKVALVTRVDEINMKADLKVLTGGGDRYEIDLTQGLTGPRSFWGGVPEVNSLVIIGYRRTHKQLSEAVILGYIPVGNKSGLRFDPFAVDSPSSVDSADTSLYEEMFGPTRRYKRLMLRPGDVGGMSASGSELTLTKDVRLTNRSGESIELRDADRTLITQAIHRVDTDAGVKHLSGPVRRSAFYLPPDIFQADGKTLKNEKAPYYGRDELQAAGPGTSPGGATKFSNMDGKVLDLFNDTREFPPVTYTNGRRVHYPPTSPAISIEDPDNHADAFVERRVEMSHTSDLTQEVLEEIEGFSMDRRMPYIEKVFGTLVGNSLNSTRDQRQYGRILKPRIFPDFNTTQVGRFTLEEVDRQPSTPDLEAYTSAGAAFLRVRPPRGVGDNTFVAAVSKQGKLFLNIPASSVEDYPSGAKKISAEMNLEGALKAFIGASAPDRISVHATLEGGLHADIGRDAKGNAVTLNYHSAVKTTYEGNPNEDDVALSVNVKGVKETAISGAERKTIEGSKQTLVSGQYQVQSDRFSVNTFGGASFNLGELNQLVAGKSQLQYALALIETIVLGGKVSTILAGGLVQNVGAGAVSYTAAAGAMSFAVPGGAYSVTVGTGAISITTAAGAVALSTASGAMSLAAAAGAISMSAGLALNIAAGTAISLVAPQVLVGGPAAVLGVLRGLPSLPPGTPTLDPITGTPLLGSATFRSI